MNQFSNHVNKEYKRNLSDSFDENIHSMSNGGSLSLQSFVDDIPFEFNPKYRTIIVSNIDIPEYDTSQIRDILSKPVDFTLENKVLLEALDDLKRKKQEFEADISHQQLSTVSNCQSSDSSSGLPVNYPLLSSHRSTSSTGGYIPVIDDSNSIKNVPSPPPRSSSSYHLTSVRDISWPSSNEQESNIRISCSSTIPTPIKSNSIKQKDSFTNNSNSIHTNDLTATFDERLTSDDPFNDAELKSLNDVAELNHLYLAIGSGNTVRR